MPNEVHRTLRARSASARMSLSDYLLADITQLAERPHVSLANRMWDLRHNITADDAAFITLAEILGVPLVTCDARMARAPGHRPRWRSSRATDRRLRAPHAGR